MSKLSLKGSLHPNKNLSISIPTNFPKKTKYHNKNIKIKTRSITNPTIPPIKHAYFLYPFFCYFSASTKYLLDSLTFFSVIPKF